METLGPFELLEYLGDDPPWRLYLARPLAGASPYRHPSTGEVVLQVPTRPIALEDQSSAALGLQHPHIERVLAHEPGEPYFVTELVRGWRLHHLLAALGRFPLDAAVAVVRQLCQGLHQLHELTGPGQQPGAVHGALRTDRVLVTTAGEAQARNPGLELGERARPSRLSLAPPIIVERLSPEQVIGLPVDRRSDVYQLGLLLHELLSGRSAFQRGAPFVTLAAIRDEPAQPPSRWTPWLPPELDQVVLRALEKPPEHRYQTASELDQALAELQRAVPLSDGAEPILAAVEASGLHDRPRIAGLR